MTTPLTKSGDGAYTPGTDTPASAIAALFRAHGTHVIAGSNRPFRLFGDAVWLVENGFIDVFAVGGAHSPTPGVRRHVARFEVGEPLFGASPEPGPQDGALLAVGSVDSSLHRLDRATMESLCATSGNSADASHLAETWASRIWSGSLFERIPQSKREAPMLGHVTLKAGDIATPTADEILWLTLTEGDADLFGRPALRLPHDVACPLARRAWVRAATDCVAHASSGATRHGPLSDSLIALHQIIQRCAENAAEEASAENRQRLERRTAENRATLSEALHELHATVARQEAIARPARENTDDVDRYEAVLDIMRRVAKPLALTVTAPTAAARLTSASPIEVIARVSRFRIRRVLLSGEWWNADAGPLLGFVKVGEGVRPVALLPAGRNAYEARSATGVRPIRNAETAAEVEPYAYTLYRPFPEKTIRALDLARFAMQGSIRDFVMVGVLGFTGGLIAMLVPLASGMLFDTVIPSANRGQLVQLTAALIVIGVASSMFELTRSMTLLRIEGRMGAVLQAALWDRLLALPLRFFRQYTSGELATRAMSIDQIRQVLTGSVLSGLIGGIFSMFSFGLMFSLSTSLAWRGTALIAVALAAVLTATFTQMKALRAVTDLRSKSAGLVLQLLTSITKLRAAAAEVRAYSIWARAFAAQRKQQYWTGFVRNCYITFNSVFPIAASITIFAALGLVATGGAPTPGAAPAGPAVPPLTTGMFVAFLGAFSSCLSATLATGQSLMAVIAVIPMYEQAKSILDCPPEITSARRDPGTLQGDVEVQQVVFRYVEGAPTVLRNVSFHARAGEYLAVVGPSGSGKSTLIRLLLGFDTPESGAVYLDGQDISGLDTQAVRRQIGVVLQNGRISSGDIFTNIAGSSLATIDDAWEAATMAGFADDIREMPMGMHTVISEGAGTLSGGQRQRLMIARALISRPKIILFDEATSALDNRTQAIVSESLAKLNVTRIVVAHRLSTIVGADRILVIKDGEAVETGTYDELMRLGGVFADLAQRQLA